MKMLFLHHINNTDMKNKLVYLTGIILAAGLTRLLPHPWNFTPMVGITLMGSTLIANRKLSVLLPLLVWVITDFLVNIFIYAKPVTDFLYFISAERRMCPVLYGNDILHQLFFHLLRAELAG